MMQFNPEVKVREGGHANGATCRFGEKIKAGMLRRVIECNTIAKLEK
jgi:hypothetical protein